MAISLTGRTDADSLGNTGLQIAEENVLAGVGISACEIGRNTIEGYVPPRGTDRRIRGVAIANLSRGIDANQRNCARLPITHVDIAERIRWLGHKVAGATVKRHVASIGTNR